MTNTTFSQHQATLCLNNRQLAEKLGANEGSVSRWRKDMAIPEYIAGYLELLVTVHQNAINLTLTLGEIIQLSQRAERAKLSFSDYIITLVRADIAAPDNIAAFPAVPGEESTARVAEDAVEYKAAPVSSKLSG